MGNNPTASPVLVSKFNNSEVLFKKIRHTRYSPVNKPVMVWDGTCGFCKYWITKWQKITGDRIQYEKYQDKAHDFPDIPESYFKQAVRLIDIDGSVYSGPDAAYKTFSMARKGPFGILHSWYENSKTFMALSDLAYQIIADHRSFFSKVTTRLFGKNP